MAQITWDNTGERFYETGVDHGVLYIPDAFGAYKSGYAWNGLVSVSESPSGAEANPKYADNIKYLNLVSAEEFGATIEAYTYPKEFAQCDGTFSPTKGVYVAQQSRRSFGLSYRTLVGNDLEGADYGYKLHLIYGCLAAPSERSYGTVNDSPEAITFSWEITTSPAAIPGMKPSASIVVDSTEVSESGMRQLENILYGTDSTAPRLPLPAEVIALISSSVDETPTPTLPTNPVDPTPVDPTPVDPTPVDPTPVDPPGDTGGGPPPVEPTNPTAAPSMTDAMGEPGIFTIVKSVAEDPNDPGTYLSSNGALVEDTSDIGTYLIRSI